jgi:hypothetical protein
MNTIALARFVRVPVFSVATGYSVKAVERKIESGAWRQGHEYRVAPDGHILVDIKGYERWVEGQTRAA